MSKVFLISSNTTTEPYPVYPLGMALVAAALVERGHEVRQFDWLVAGQSEQALHQALDEFSPDVISLSLRNIDNVDSFSSEDGWYLAEARRLVGLFRQASDSPVVVGGPAFSIMPEAILEYLRADHGVAGEGEKALCELVEGLAAGRSMPPLYGGGQDLLGTGEMFHPLLVKEFVDFYLDECGMANLQSKRGCPHACDYCTYPELEGNRFRFRDPAEVVDDAARLQRDFGVQSIFFTDSVFNDAAGHYLQVAEELIRRDLGISWSGFFRPQGLSGEGLALMKRSGLYAMELGTDAACDRTLDGLEKEFCFDDVLQVQRRAIAAEIPCAHFIMFGGPEETMETVREGLLNIERLESCVVFAFSGIRVLPGTPMHGRAIADGVVRQGDSLLKPVYYFSPGVECNAMNETITEAFRGRKDRIFPPSEGQVRMKVMNDFGFKGILWDKLISFNKKKSALAS